MKLFLAREMQAVDEAAAQAGVALMLSMESAGRAVAAAAQKHWPDRKRVLVLCGKGNNGGDGYVAARHLLLAGHRVTVLEVARSGEDSGSEESRTARAALLAQGSGRSEAEELSEESVQAALETHDLIVDALFGSGLSRALEGLFKTVVERVNASGLPVLSIDLPSGSSADEAQPLGPHIRATRTVQLAAPKRSSVLHPAAEAYGAWEVAGIGIPEPTLEGGSKIEVLTPERVAAWLPTRPQDTHKYEVGTVLVVAGSKRYGGAAEMACRAAYRAGAGLVTLASEAQLPVSWPEIIFERIDWDEDAVAGLGEISEKRRMVRVIGPGLDERAVPVLPRIIAQSSVPTLLDAGALAGGKAWVNAVRNHGRCVLTPHAGEASGLLERSAGSIGADPIGAAQALAEKHHVVAVLKGATSVVAAPGGRVAVSSRSHPGMATGGTGDVLSGFIGAFLAGADDLFTRTCAAVFLHGMAGQQAAKRYGNGLIATDLLETFPGVWLELTGEKG